MRIYKTLVFVPEFFQLLFTVKRTFAERRTLVNEISLVEYLDKKIFFVVVL